MKHALTLVAVLAVPVCAATPAPEFFQSLKSIRAKAAVVAGSYGSFSGTEDQLLELSKDSDPSVRKAAVRGMRNYMHNSRVRDRVEDLLGERGETVEVRAEAVKDMSVFLNDWRANSKLKDLASASGEDLRLRALAMKSLYNSAALDYSIRGYLADVAKGWGESNLTLRAAAIWGLFSATQNDYSVRERLKDLMTSSSENLLIRVESLKSLYQAMSDYGIKDKMKDLAKSSHEPAELRTGAILALSASLNDYDVRSLLEDLSRGSQPAAVRRAATVALGDPSNPEILSYFHIGYRHGGRYYDPLEAE